MTFIKKVQSPCKGVCTYGETATKEKDSERICCGCGRSAQEITEWFHASEERKEAIVKIAKQRQVK